MCRKPSAAAAEAERERLDLTGVLDLAAASFARRLHERQGRAALAYLRGRGLRDETIQRFGLGWSGDGRGSLVAELGPRRRRPGADGGGRAAATPPKTARRGSCSTTGSSSRSVTAAAAPSASAAAALGDAKPKYINGPETAIYSKGRTLYALDLAREGARRSEHGVIVAEGYMDVIALHQAGFGGAVAPARHGAHRRAAGGTVAPVGRADAVLRRRRGRRPGRGAGLPRSRCR